MLWTVAFWKGLGERAIKTFAQTLAAFLTVGVPIFDISWTEALAITATATVASILTSIGSADFTAGSEPGRYADTTAPVDAPWDVDGDHAG